MIFIAGKKASGKDTVANAAVILGSIAEPSTQFRVIHPAKMWVMQTFQVSEDRYDIIRSKHRVYIQQRPAEVLSGDPTVLLRIIDSTPPELKRGTIVVGIRFFHERDYARAHGIPTVLLDTPNKVREQRLIERGEAFIADDPFEQELIPDQWDDVLDGTQDVQRNAMHIIQLMLRFDG